MKKIWIRKPITLLQKIIFGTIGVLLVLACWLIFTTVRMPPKKIDKQIFETKILNEASTEYDKKLIQKYYSLHSDSYLLKKRLSTKEVLKIWFVLKSADYFPEKSIPNPIINPNILPHPLDIIKAFPVLIKGTSTGKFIWKKSLIYAIWISLRRELISFSIVVFFALFIGIFMSCSARARAFWMPFLVVGTFIPIAALIPLTQAFFGIGEVQKIVFLSLGMFFVLLALVMKEMDEVDNIYLETAYTLGFSQLQTIFRVNFPIALPRIWKHFSAVFGLGWGYIIFAEMINEGNDINGIGWLFIARKRRFQIPDMYAIFFVIIIFAFLFSFLFDLVSRLYFKYERKDSK